MGLNFILSVDGLSIQAVLRCSYKGERVAPADAPEPDAPEPDAPEPDAPEPDGGAACVSADGPSEPDWVQNTATGFRLTCPQFN